MASPIARGAAMSPLIMRIEKRFGDFPLSALTDRRSRGIFMAWRDQARRQCRASAGGLCVDCPRPRPVLELQSWVGRRQPVRARRSAVSRWRSR